LVNRIIDAPDARRLCVIVNDFGALSVDAGVLARRDGAVLALANGCVCCSAAAGLYAAFDAALGLDPAPATVIVEASGVADPVRIAAVARAEPDFTPGGILTLVDPGALVALLADPLIAPDVIRQVTSADMVLLSRTDILDTPVIVNARGLVAAMSPPGRVGAARSIASLRDIDDLFPDTPRHWLPL